MFRAFAASIRLAFAFVCVGVGLILSAQWLGLVPDSRLVEEEARRKLCEHVAIASLDDIRSHRWPTLKRYFDNKVIRNPSLISVGLRSEMGTLRTASADHLEAWHPDWKSDLANQPLVRLEVPVTMDNHHWGQLEFCFRPAEMGLLWGALDPALVRMLAYFIMAGMGGYTLLMLRVLGVFRKGQVVPDRVRQALDTLAEGLLVLDDQGRIVLANRSFLAINGYEAEELQDESAAELPWKLAISGGRTAGASIDPSRLPWFRAIHERQSVIGEILRLTGRDGVERVFSVNAGPIGEDENQNGALVTFQDVTHVEQHRVELENMLMMLRVSKDEIQQKNQELEVLATRDALTGCLNRRAFFQQMATVFVECQENQRHLSCFMVDVDHFKSVNDTYGHHTGDEVLRRVSTVLRELHEQKHIVCRYGGEEFCVVMPDADLDTAFEEAERTRLAIMDIRLTDPAALRLTASLGVSELQFAPEDTQGLINQADECLYVAKRGGRNQVVAYDPEAIAAAQALPEVVEPRETTTTTTADEQGLVRLPFDVVTALLSALAYRDKATAEHSRRVADFCVTAASGLLGQRETYVLEIAGLLHDIGKIGVPDDILHKPGSLTPAEWTVMRRHNEIGFQLIRGTFQCVELENLIRYHHQSKDDVTRRDLEGDEEYQSLYTASNLLTIADTYDAITSDKPYRKGKPHAFAVEELRRCVGTQFDAELVEHFLSAIRPEDGSLPLPTGTTRGIAFAIDKTIATEIGSHIEQLAEAMDGRDPSRLATIADELRDLAETSFLMPIADCAGRVQTSAAQQNLDTEDEAWAELLSETETLLDLCRVTQQSVLVQQEGLPDADASGGGMPRVGFPSMPAPHSAP
ncbi:MAG: diguanylate cyclase [Planctomycetota bacterium]